MKKRCFLCLFVVCICMLPLNVFADSIPAKGNRAIGFTGIPEISYNRSRGMGFGAMGMMIVHLDKAHPETPPSQVMLMGQVSTEKDWMAMTFAKMHFNNDNYRIVGGGGYMNSNFQTFVNIGNSEVELPYNTYGTFVFLSPSIRVYKRLYVGISGQYFRDHLIFDESNIGGEEVSSDSYQNGLGVNLIWDSKDNQFSPSSGIFAAVIYKNFPSLLSNDSVFNKFNIIVNHYYRLNPKMILASRFATSAAIGSSVPFIAQSYVGNTDIRGYTKGEFRGDQTYALQSELRWNFYNRFGAVGFLGLAVANSPGKTSPLLPGGGVGIRYMVLPKFKTNIGVDVAAGKDDWGIYFRIGEAF